MGYPPSVDEDVKVMYKFTVDSTIGDAAMGRGWLKTRDRLDSTMVDVTVADPLEILRLETGGNRRDLR